MEKSKRELESLVVSQKEQLERYEKRLKDVVTAYKGLLKEKEALETSLNALTTSRESDAEDNKLTEEKTKNVEFLQSAEDKDYLQLQKQVITLMNSLATLSAEKSRMEASFQADKKQLRLQLAQKEEQILLLQAQQKSIEEKSNSKIEEMRKKWITERQEREMETNNQMIMIRELQKLFADERQLKENIEMQLNNFKAKYTKNQMEINQQHELQQSEVGRATDNEQLARESNDHLLEQLKNEIQQLKEQHAITLKNEQRRLLVAEEQSRKQAALHEERVANLETRLQDLSNSVGKYDRLRQQDQLNIQALKQQLHDLEYEKQKTEIFAEQEKYDEWPINHIVDKILELKRLLLLKCEHSSHTVDISKIFSVQSQHPEDFATLKQQYETVKLEIMSAEEQLKTKTIYINTLLEKVKLLQRTIEEQEFELKRQDELRQEALRAENIKWQQILNEKENQNRYKLNELEQQLQKQRQRSVQLVNEKDDEIKAMQRSFEIIKNNQLINQNPTKETLAETQSSTVSEQECMQDPTEHKSLNLSLNDNIPLLHYANELARKDKEISSLRKAKFLADNALRTAIQEKVMVQQQLHNKIAQLEEQADRFERCVSREGANLEYLKNVIVSFITTRDTEGKRHMLNAISAVLHFTPNEIQTINAIFQKK